jgi:phosphoadenosine phosphosulfate reductase
MEITRIVPSPGHRIAVEHAVELANRLAGLEGAALLEPLIRKEFSGRIAVVSSFGTESAILLALAAEVDPAVPVLFLDTWKLFGETKRYRDTLIARLGLTDVRTLGPEPAEVAAQDPKGMLFDSDHEACCNLRKVQPLDRALTPFLAWISGRKRFHGGERTALPVVEAERNWIKINPLATWSRERIEAEFTRRNLPRHPLEADGYLSVGCMPCSDRVDPGADFRSGRWAGKGKTECGIHRRGVPVPAGTVPAFF